MESNSPALLCLDVQKWVKCDNRVKPVRMFSNLICSPMMVCKSDKVVINKKKQFLHEKPIAVRHLQPSDQIYYLSKKKSNSMQI